LIICVNAACIVDWLDSLIEDAENNVDDHRHQVDPEEVLECLSGTEVQKAELRYASRDVVNPEEETIKDGHVGNELPIIFLQNTVCANCVHEACSSWD